MRNKLLYSFLFGLLISLIFNILHIPIHEIAAWFWVALGFIGFSLSLLFALAIAIALVASG